MVFQRVGYNLETERQQTGFEHSFKKHSDPQVLMPGSSLTTERHSLSPPGAHKLVGDKNKHLKIIRHLDIRQRKPAEPPPGAQSTGV